MAVLAVAFLGDEAAGSVLGVDGSLGVIVDEVLLPDDLIKRQTHDSFPYPTRKTRWGPCPVTGRLPGTACGYCISLYHGLS